MFSAVGRWCARRPGTVVAVWALLLAAALGAAGWFGRAVTDDVSLPGSDSQAALDVLGKAFPGTGTGTQPVVLHTSAGGPALTTDRSRAAVTSAARAIAGVPHVTAVTTPYDAAGQGAMSKDGHTAYLTVRLDVSGRNITPGLTHRITSAAHPAADAGIEVTPGGQLAGAVDKGTTGRSEAIGAAAAFLVLTLAFGGLLAAVLPLALGALGLGISLSLLALVGHLTDVPSSAETIAAMIGLGVGIDYSLFSLTRFRQLRAAGAGVEDAAVRTTAGSGKSVAFAGTAVIAALAGLALGGLPLLDALALAPGIAVLTALLVNLTLLPALLTLLGRRLTPRKTAPAEGARGWARVAERVAARPWRLLLAATAVLAVCAAPAATLTFGQLDAGTKAAGTDSRLAYDRMTDAFGPGSNGPLQVTDTLPAPASGPADPRLTGLTRALRATHDVASAGDPRLSTDRRTALWQVTPRTAPGDPATAALVRHLREVTLPEAAGHDGQVAHVGGTPATQTDLNARIAARMPLVGGFVLAMAGLLLLLAFRSPLVAAKAAVLNLVSVAAAYGILTAVFQWGRGASLIGLDGAVPVPGYVPLLMFAVLFGLSMDYEVFLLSSVREAYLRHGDNRRAVVDGLGSTGRIISSAALIMVSVFLSYLLSDDPVVKMFGIGLACAVALDATVVRGILVPASMVLLGRANWWLPRLLDRVLPRVEREGA
ncbi:MMPL family transporter [Streptomyces sp. NPDC007205]|uniref:MMPL family transporter n=1 Tax=Streptomyces sp. NPDC007205 TaxID=3154316 RepID=UPI0033EAA16D